MAFLRFKTADELNYKKTALIPRVMDDSLTTPDQINIPVFNLRNKGLSYKCSLIVSRFRPHNKPHVLYILSSSDIVSFLFSETKLQISNFTCRSSFYYKNSVV